MTGKQKRVSPLRLERYLVGDVSPGEKQSLERVFAEDGEAAEALSALRESDREIRNQYPAELMINSIMTRAKNTRLKKGRRPFPVMARIITAAGVAGVAAAIVFIILPLLNTASLGSPPEDRIKGNPDAPVSTELRAYLKTNPPAALGDQAVTEAGNTIQLAYTVGAAGNRYGVIFSIDGRGAVSLHYPYTQAGTTRLVQGKETALDEAYTLDDAPDYEIFFFLIAETPMDVGAILRAAEKLAPQTAPGDNAALFAPYEVTSLTLRKAETTK